MEERKLIPEEMEYLQSEEFVQFFIWSKYGSIRNMAKEKGLSHTSIRRYIDRFVEGNPPRKKVKTGYNFYSFLMELRRFHKEFEKFIQKIEEKEGIKKETTKFVIQEFLKNFKSIS